MKKVLINYADKRFFQSQTLNIQSAKEVGGFDEAVPYNYSNIDQDFLLKHRHILSQPRGAGYWLWKPYFILKQLNQMNNGDILFYCDSGSHFIDSVDKILNCVDFTKQDIIPFGVDPHRNDEFTKMDVFVFNECEKNIEITSAVMILSSFHLIKNSEASREFYYQFLFQCCHENLITDCPNVLGQDNFENFKDHRHDQSIYSILCRLNGFEVYRDPSHYGEWSMDRYKNSDYPTIINHTRSQS